MSHFGLVQDFTGTITASSGSGSASIGTDHNIIYTIEVFATTATTTFDLSLTDEDGFEFYGPTNNTNFVRYTEQIPMREAFTLAIANASADEAFTYKIRTLRQP